MKIANAHSVTKTWTLRLFTFFVWAAVGLCAAYWAYKFVTTQAVAATAAVAAPAVVVDTKAVAKLLGATDNVAAKPAITAPNVKLTLFGLATTRNGNGYALIAIEDKPAKPYRVGAQVTDDLVLKSISKVDAVLASSNSAPDGPKLELPVRKPATFVASSTPNAAGGQVVGAQPQIPGMRNPITHMPTQQPSAGAPPSVPPPALAPGTIPDAAPSGRASNPATGSPILTETLRPTSRFAPRADGSAPAMPSTINPAAAASSAVSTTPDGAAR